MTDPVPETVPETVCVMVGDPLFDVVCVGEPDPERVPEPVAETVGDTVPDPECVGDVL